MVRIHPGPRSRALSSPARTTEAVQSGGVVERVDGGRLAQRQSIAFTLRGSQVQILHRPHG